MQWVEKSDSCGIKVQRKFCWTDKYWHLGSQMHLVQWITFGQTSLSMKARENYVADCVKTTLSILHSTKDKAIMIVTLHLWAMNCVLAWGWGRVSSSSDSERLENEPSAMSQHVQDVIHFLCKSVEFAKDLETCVADFEDQVHLITPGSVISLLLSDNSSNLLFVHIVQLFTGLFLLLLLNDNSQLPLFDIREQDFAAHKR